MVKSKRGYLTFFAMLIVGAYHTSGRPVFAQDAGWVSETFASLQRLVDERTALSAVLEPYIDTSEPKHGTIPIIVQISTNVPPGRNSVIAGGPGYLASVRRFVAETGFPQRAIAC